MDEIKISDYYSLSIEDREYIDNLINQMEVEVETLYEGLTKELLIEEFEITEDDISEIIEDIKKLRVYNGKNPSIIEFNEKGLYIKESTIQCKEEFKELILKLPTVYEKALNIENLNEKSINKISSIVREKRILLYKDINPDRLDILIKKNDILISRIFKMFRKISILKGYKANKIYLTEEGLFIEQEAISNEEEYLRLIKTDKIIID